MFQLLKHKIREWRCRLLHKHMTKEIFYPGYFFPPEVVLYRGCKKCDLWQELPNPDGYIK